jgi:hypothetical protein
MKGSRVLKGPCSARDTLHAADNDPATGLPPRYVALTSSRARQAAIYSNVLDRALAESTDETEAAFASVHHEFYTRTVHYKPYTNVDRKFPGTRPALSPALYQNCPLCQGVEVNCALCAILGQAVAILSTRLGPTVFQPPHGTQTIQSLKDLFFGEYITRTKRPASSESKYLPLEQLMGPHSYSSTSDATLVNQKIIADEWTHAQKRKQRDAQIQTAALNGRLMMTAARKHKATPNDFSIDIVDAGPPGTKPLIAERLL